MSKSVPFEYMLIVQVLEKSSISGINSETTLYRLCYLKETVMLFLSSTKVDSFRTQ